MRIDRRFPDLERELGEHGYVKAILPRDRSIAFYSPHGQFSRVYHPVALKRGNTFRLSGAVGICLTDKLENGDLDPVDALDPSRECSIIISIENNPDLIGIGSFEIGSSPEIHSFVHDLVEFLNDLVPDNIDAICTLFSTKGSWLNLLINANLMAWGDSYENKVYKLLSRRCAH